MSKLAYVLLALLVAISCTNKELEICPYSSVYYDSIGGKYRLHLYYEVLNYNGDSSKLCNHILHLMDSMVPDKYKKYDDLSVFIFKGNYTNCKEQENNDKNKYNYKDLIAELQWISNGSAKHKWNFYK
ncbi:hypothetical protein QEG73_13450 [Chitinophagaceae bacterium 26-R-25]|nr:hypothetical protein [Chitinophagaceae bacterium 26-R-25]